MGRLPLLPPPRSQLQRLETQVNQEGQHHRANPGAWPGALPSVPWGWDYQKDLLPFPTDAGKRQGLGSALFTLMPPGDP